MDSYWGSNLRNSGLKEKKYPVINFPYKISQERTLIRLIQDQVPGTEGNGLGANSMIAIWAGWWMEME